jgi:hypothetical protein
MEEIIFHQNDHEISMDPDLHWYWSNYRSGVVQSKNFLQLIGRKRCGSISFVGGNTVEVRLKQTKISTRQEVHKRGVIRIQSTDYN